jgi:uncharacterized NAD(P)/FAD-binding protein YdhS
MKTADTESKIGKTIAIIGGGVSGSLTAYHLIEQHAQARIVVIDPRPELGLGLAYSTPSFRHLLNVPAGKISALPTQPEHFLSWLRANYDAEATTDTFASRAVFGRYIRALLEESSEIEQIRATVVDYRPVPAGGVLLLSDGSELRAELVVLATGNFVPSTLHGVSKEATLSGTYRHNAWLPDTFDGLESDAPVTLIGTGLTGVDVLLRLRELSHRGTITAVSRHGVFPNRHAPYTLVRHSAIPIGTPATCLAYLRVLRAAIRDGAEWRAAIDSLRSTTNELWLALPHREQARFRRHLLRRWDIVRHRMAPPIADLIEAELAVGSLVVRKGNLVSVEASTGGATVKIRTSRGLEELATGRVINCTGPGMDYRRVDSPLLRSLFSQRLVTTGPLGGGFDSSECGAMIGVNGLASPVLFNLGPGRLGTLLESIAIPEIRQQAVQLATMLVQRIGNLEQPKSISRSQASNGIHTRW